MKTLHHSHKLFEPCDQSGCETDRYADGMHYFSDVSVSSPGQILAIQENPIERDGNLGEVVDRRQQIYGDAIEQWTRIAQVWSGILGHEVQPVEAALCMIGLKAVRAAYMPDYSDNTDDIEGYLDIVRKVVGEDMIHARSVNDFIKQKWGE